MEVASGTTSTYLSEARAQRSNAIGQRILFGVEGSGAGATFTIVPKSLSTWWRNRNLSKEDRAKKYDASSVLKQLRGKIADQGKRVIVIKEKYQIYLSRYHDLVEAIAARKFAPSFFERLFGWEGDSVKKRGEFIAEHSIHEKELTRETAVKEMHNRRKGVQDPSSKISVEQLKEWLTREIQAKIAEHGVGWREMRYLNDLKTQVPGCDPADLEQLWLALDGPKSISWKPRELPIEDASKKMKKNAEKAIEEHWKADRPEKSHDNPPYATVEEVAASEKPSSGAVQLAHGDSSEQGPRPSMEDAHFYVEFPSGGTLAGVFDGHGGSEVSKYVCKEFQKRFPEALDRLKNVHQAFERVIDDIQNEVTKHNEWNDQGSTAVVSFIDAENTVYTATLGDSEANIYRKINGSVKSIPLSCVRDFGSDKDAAAAARAMREPEKAVEWPKEKEPKSLRVSGVNVSRGFGDQGRVGGSGLRAISSKPKITMRKLQPGDVFILTCDGLKDYVDEADIDEIIAKHSGEDARTIAQELSKRALENMERLRKEVLLKSKGQVKISGDNVTIIAIKASAKK